jgi:hypothetical protein
MVQMQAMMLSKSIKYLRKQSIADYILLTLGIDNRLSSL